MLKKLFVNLPKDPYDAFEYMSDIFQSQSDFTYKEMVDFYTLFKVITLKVSGEFILAPELTMQYMKDAINENIEKSYPEIRTKIIEQLYEAHILSELIPEATIKAIQEKINVVRKSIQEALIDEDFKKRLLCRLEKLQTELHKDNPDKDRLFAIITKVGLSMRELGENSKPLADNISNIIDSAADLFNSIAKLDPTIPSLPSNKNSLFLPEHSLK